MSQDAIYSRPRRCRKRLVCDGHLAERHYIEAGDLIVRSALPPNSNEVGNVGWWHAAFCIDCAPIETLGETWFDWRKGAAQ